MTQLHSIEVEANLRKAPSPDKLCYRSLTMWTPWETSKECPDFKYMPPFTLEGDVTVCIYIGMLRTSASIIGVADWTSPLRLHLWSWAGLMIMMSTPSHSQHSMLTIRYSLRSRLPSKDLLQLFMRPAPQFIQEAESVALLHDIYAWRNF